MKAAVERVFALRTASLDMATQQQRAGVRRPSSAVADLAERLLEAVQACPGKTMAVLAARMGEKSRVLHRPMMRLMQAGRVRSFGVRNATRYFSMGKKAA